MNLWVSLWKRPNTTSPGVLFGIPQCHHNPGFCNNFDYCSSQKTKFAEVGMFLLMAHSKKFGPSLLQLASRNHKVSRDVSHAKQAMKHGLIKTTWDHTLEHLNTTESVPIHCCYCVWSWQLDLLMENKLWKFCFLINSVIRAWSVFWARYYQHELVLTGFLLDKTIRQTCLQPSIIKCLERSWGMGMTPQVLWTCACTLKRRLSIFCTLLWNRTLEMVGIVPVSSVQVSSSKWHALYSGKT